MKRKLELNKNKYISYNILCDVDTKAIANNNLYINYLDILIAKYKIFLRILINSNYHNSIVDFEG